VGGDIRLHTAPGTPAYNLGRRDRGPQSAEGIKREKKKRGIRKKRKEKRLIPFSPGVVDHRIA